MADEPRKSGVSKSGKGFGVRFPRGPSEGVEARLARRLSMIRHRIAVISGKGGVGKSTVAVNVAATLAAWGRRVGILDGDIHGPDVPEMFGLEGLSPESGPDGLVPPVTGGNIKVMSMAFLIGTKDTPVSWRGPLKHSLFQQFLADVQWGELDYLIVDLPSGTGDEPASIAQLLGKPLWILVVTTPQKVALLDSRKAVIFSKTLDTEVLGILENMSGLECQKCRETINLFKSGGGEKAAEELGVPFLGRIPIDPQIVSSGDAGVPIVFADPDSLASKAFEQVALTVDRFVTGTHS